MTIEFEKSTVNLDDTKLFVRVDEENTYFIISKSEIHRTKDLETINSFGYEDDITQEEVDKIYKDGYKYISYWDGSNMCMIDLENDFHQSYSLDVNDLELIDQKDSSDLRFAEYALIREKSTNMLYIVIGTSSYANDVYPKLISIDDASEYYDIFN